jgi:hypothetical protein
VRLARAALAALQLAVLVGILLAAVGWGASWTIRPYASEVLAALVDITVLLTPLFLVPALILGLLRTSVRAPLQVLCSGGAARGRGARWLMVFVLLAVGGYAVSLGTWAKAYDLQHEAAQVISLPLALLATWALQIIGSAASPRWPRPRAELWLVTAVLLITFLVLDPLPRVRMGLIAPAVMVLYLLLGTTLAVSLAQRQWPRVLHDAAGLLGVACFGLLALGVGDAAGRHPLGRPALEILRFVDDQDADGFSDGLGGGDCDDADPTVNPLALEVVGNGRDDNCHAGDLSAAVALPRANPKAGEQRRDVVLISIDTLRADMLTPEYMPNLWRFAQRARRYTQAYSAASFTDLSLRSLFTGWPASDFDITGVLTGMDRPLADLMSEAGWQTFALHPVPDLGELVLLGFQQVNDDPSGRHRTPNGTSAPQVTALALELLRQTAAAPRLLWTHYYEPHHQYLRHAGFERFGDSSLGRYHQEVAFVDQQIAPLLEWLARPEVAANSVVILFADHGEYLGERGGRSGHDLTLFQPVMRVPLLVSAPDVPSATVETPVSLLDVFPTVLNLAGISGVEPRAGFDLLEPPAHRLILAEARDSRGGAPSLALRAEGKLLYCVERSNHCELCDERMDPECRHPDVSPGGLTRDPLHRDMGLLLDSYRNDARHRARKEAFGARWFTGSPP